MVRIVNLAQYVTLTLVELLMFTYFGELLRGHSVRCGEAFWRSQWWTHTIPIRQDILILLANSKRAVRLTAGKFYAMDIERLRSVSEAKVEHMHTYICTYIYIYYILFRLSLKHSRF